MKAGWWAVIVLPAVAATGWLLWRERPVSVTLATAHRGEAVELVYATGYVEPEAPVDVAARVTAPVSRVLVREGERVRRGEPLVLLDAGEQAGQLAQARAERERAALHEARTITLFRQGWVTRATRDQAVASARSARGAEESARSRLAQYSVTAGIDGIVLRRDVEPGDLATPTRTLMQLGDPARIRITATVDERDVPRVIAGQPALLRADAWPNRVIRGHVSALTPAGDPRERAFRVRIALDEQAALPIGLSLEVNIVTQQVRDALLIPATALENGRLWVVEEGRAQPRTVRTGIIGTEQAQILSGLEENRSLIVDPPQGLEPGTRVRAR